MRILCKNSSKKKKVNTSQLYVDHVTQTYYYVADQSKWHQREDGVESVK